MSQYIDRKSSVLQTSICESRFYVASDFATTLFRIIHAMLYLFVLYIKANYKILTIYERAKALCEALLTLSENRRNVLIVQIILNDMSLRYMKLKLDKSALREAAPNPQLISHFVFQHHLAPLFSMTMCQI